MKFPGLHNSVDVNKRSQRFRFVQFMSWSDRVWVDFALLAFLFGFGYSVYSLATGKFLTPRITFFSICAGFLFETIYLVVRGQEIGRCPITNRFEVIVFMAWSMVLIYLVIGPAYRLSLMGAFTAPGGFCAFDHCDFSTSVRLDGCEDKG